MSEKTYTRIGAIFLLLVLVGLFLYTKNGISNTDQLQIYQGNSAGVQNAGVGAEVPTVSNKTIETAVVNSNINLNNNTDIKNMNATLHTNKGDITIEFKTVGVPNTVANFIKLAKEGFYDGVKFHRVIKGFMIQGGDPNTKNDSAKGQWGMGGPGYTFKDELTADNKNDIGTISMANSGPNTNGSQFFINTASNNFLDSKHAVFGKISAGMDVISAIENTQVDGSDRPLTPVVIESVSVR